MIVGTSTVDCPVRSLMICCVWSVTSEFYVHSYWTSDIVQASACPHMSCYIAMDITSGSKGVVFESVVCRGVAVKFSEMLATL